MTIIWIHMIFNYIIMRSALDYRIANANTVSWWIIKVLCSLCVMLHSINLCTRLSYNYYGELKMCYSIALWYRIHASQLTHHITFSQITLYSYVHIISSLYYCHCHIVITQFSESSGCECNCFSVCSADSEDYYCEHLILEPTEIIYNHRNENLLRM